MAHTKAVWDNRRMAATFVALWLFAWASALAIMLSDNQIARQLAWLVPWLWIGGAACLIFAALCSRWFRSIYQRFSVTERERVNQETHGSSKAINAGRDVHYHEAAKGPQISSDEVELRANLKNMLGNAIQKGEQVHAQNDSENAYHWLTETRDLITKAFGAGEAALFLSDAGYKFSSGQGPVKNKILGRLRRLGELIARIDTIPLLSEFISASRTEVPRGPFLEYVAIEESVQWKFQREMSLCMLSNIVIKNAQTAIPETAYNVRAAITYQHADGIKRLVVDRADWLNWNPITSSQPGRYLVGRINLESNEDQKLVILIQHADSTYYASCQEGEQFQPLALGEWILTVKITSDNTKPLTLQGAIELTRVNGRTRMEHKTNLISGKKFTRLTPSEEQQDQQSR